MPAPAPFPATTGSLMVSVKERLPRKLFSARIGMLTVVNSEPAAIVAVPVVGPE
jgi:hypothetical protein